MKVKKLKGGILEFGPIPKGTKRVEIRITPGKPSLWKRFKKLFEKKYTVKLYMGKSEGIESSGYKSYKVKQDKM